MLAIVESVSNLIDEDILSVAVVDPEAVAIGTQCKNNGCRGVRIIFCIVLYTLKKQVFSKDLKLYFSDF